MVVADLMPLNIKKHIPKHNLNEKDNIIKPKKKFKQLKTQQHLVAKLQTNFSPQKRTMPLKFQPTAKLW